MVEKLFQWDYCCSCRLSCRCRSSLRNQIWWNWGSYLVWCRSLLVSCHFKCWLGMDNLIITRQRTLPHFHFRPFLIFESELPAVTCHASNPSNNGMSTPFKPFHFRIQKSLSFSREKNAYAIIHLFRIVLDKILQFIKVW